MIIQYHRIMRIRRSSLISPARGQYFHVTSRVVDKRFIFGDEEKEYFLRIMRRYEAFSGVQVLSYCLMSNHFHLLIYVPPRPEVIPEKEVLSRMKSLYGKEQMSEFLEYLETLEGELLLPVREAFLNRFRERMYNLSHFARELKLRFSKYYNGRHDRKGTLWEERFKSCLVEGHENALMNTAAYIELNPVRAGIVNDPSDYRWCSYTEAQSGNKNARMGIIRLASGRNTELKYRDSIKRYRSFFEFKSAAQSESRRGMNSEHESKSIDSGVSAPSEEMGKFLSRVRYFTDGVVLGSKEFIEEWYKKNVSTLNRNRKRISNKIKNTSMEQIHTYRKVDL